MACGYKGFSKFCKSVGEIDLEIPCLLRRVKAELQLQMTGVDRALTVAGITSSLKFSSVLDLGAA